jgi:single-strand DNA-binding protein
MEITGIIKRISQTDQVSAKFKKREWVITTSEQYPQHINLECHQDKVSLLDSLKVGDQVTAGINIRGKEWTSPTGEVRFFNSLVAWKVDKASQAPEQFQNSAPKAADAMAPLANGEDDDLPF